MRRIPLRTSSRPLLALLLLMSACERAGDAGVAGDPVPEERRYGGQVVIGGIVDPPSMNALVSNESVSRMFQQSVLFMPLLRYDPGLRAEPWLAERWDTTRVAPDSLELVFHLRRDVAWHDGAPTDADDVLFTYARVRHPAVASALAGGFAHYSPEAVRVDAGTVKFRLRAHAEFLDPWTTLPILPRHLLEDVPPAQLATHPFGTRAPVGNGPFRFVERTPGQSWTFEANPAFPAALGGRPYLDRLVYRVVPDQTTLLAELLTGAVDVYLAVNPSQAEQIRGSANAALVASPAPLQTYIAWNSRNPLFDTPQERRALSMALDRAQLVSAILGEHGDPGRSAVTPAHWAFERQDGSTSVPHSVQAARQLLAQVGWLDRDRDGVLEDASGRPFRFTLKAPAGNQARIDLVQMVQAQLKEVGVDVRPSILEGNTLIGQLMGRKNARGELERDFEAVVMGWTDNVRKDDSNLFHSRHLDGPFQITSFSNPRVDVLLDTLGLIVDREQARPLWKEYQALMAEHAPQTVLYYPHRLTGLSRRLQGAEMDARGELVSVARWWLRPEGGAKAAAP